MGAHNVAATFDGQLSKEQLRDQFRALQDQMTTEYGTNPYNGTFSTCNGLIIDDKKTFEKVNEADDYALDRAEKWGPACAVKLKRDGVMYWYVAGWAAS